MRTRKKRSGETQQMRGYKAKLLHMAEPFFCKPNFKYEAERLVGIVTAGVFNSDFYARKLYAFILGVNGVRVKKQKTSPESFFASSAWRAVRYDALARSGGRCVLCGASPSTGAVLQVDHTRSPLRSVRGPAAHCIKPRYLHPELELAPSNLQVLCQDCNLGKGAGGPAVRRASDNRSDCAGDEIGWENENAHWRSL